jgi:DNA helicase-2/ATP-dependent DNA helicase PcrA
MLNLSDLNSKQLQATTAPLGPVLVLAGPGSGKTKTLTARIAYLVDKKLVKPENILALTFTNKAAKEMRSRVARLLLRYQGAASKLTMGTFHAVCARLLRAEIPALNYGRDFVIFDSDDQHKLLREICDMLRLDERFPPALFSAMISRAKNILQTPMELDLGLQPPFAEILQTVYARYQDALFSQNALDFDDLLMLMVKILEEADKTLFKYQKKFAYILVDEYQDTNPAQYALLKLLAVHQNLFVVGDDAQSIYGFRGSDIRNILNFEADFPSCQVIKLEQNYRSSQNILAAAQKVIELNSEQKPKTLWTQNGLGEKVMVYLAEDERMEAEFVANKIITLAPGGAAPPPHLPDLQYEPEGSFEKEGAGYSILDRILRSRKKFSRESFAHLQSLLPQLPKKHQSLKEFCVLYRTHAQSRALEEVFIQAAIPYQIVGGLKFYERREIKDMLAYLRLVLNYRDLVSLKRVINEPPRALGEKSYLLIRDLIVDSGSGKKDISLDKFLKALSALTLSSKAAAAAQEFFGLLSEISRMPKTASLSQVMKLLVRKTGYDKYLRDGTEMGETRWENVLELFGVAGKFSAKGGSASRSGSEDPSGSRTTGGKALSWKDGALNLLEEVALLSEIDQKDEAKDSVTLMTLHSAKGLEFDNVFFVGLEEGILPHSRSLLQPNELAEEIRLAYVGLTRARQRLFLVLARSRRLFGEMQEARPSRVLKVLPKENLQLLGPAKRLFEETEGELVVEEVEY